MVSLNEFQERVQPCIVCMMAVLSEHQDAVHCSKCRTKFHASCASQLFRPITTESEFLAVPGTTNILKNPETNFTCDTCFFKANSKNCILCNQLIGKEQAKISECILSDQNREWVHLKCARWHEEIRIESLRRFMFTDKKSLRQNEEKSIGDCSVCDQAKQELLTKCLKCEKYAHPSCVSEFAILNRIYCDKIRCKVGFSCCGKVQGDQQWEKIDFGVRFERFKTIVKRKLNAQGSKKSLACEVCTLPIKNISLPDIISNYSDFLETINYKICSICNLITHKKCLSKCSCTIVDTGGNCSLCGKSGSLKFDKHGPRHPVCDRYAKICIRGICLICKQPGQVIRCQECPLSIHPLCLLQESQSSHKDVKSFIVQLRRCKLHAQIPKMKTRSDRL